MELMKKIEGTRQFGDEFLTWLMYKSLTSDGILESGLGKIELWFEDKVKLVSPYSGGEINILKGESPAQSDEMLVALQKGKHINEASMSVTYQGRTFEFQVSGPDMAVSSVKVPAVLGETDFENIIERFDLLATLEEILRSLYHVFLKMRLDDEAWAGECRRIGSWLTR